jgi:archaemetzincin
LAIAQEYMAQSPFLYLVALGPVDPKLLRLLRTCIANHFSLPARILDPKPLPPHTYHVMRNQYHSTQLLEYLLKDEYTEPFRVLGVTAVDLYIPIFTFVFGEAQLDGRAALISIFRPGGGADGVRPPRALFLDRLTKLGAHELGHTFGLGHCQEEGCLMGFAANLEKLDQKNLTLCKYCHVLMTDYLRNTRV